MQTFNNQFNPIHNAHAIVEVIVFFGFPQGELGPHIVDRFLELKTELSEDFPSNNLFQMFEVKISEDYPSLHPKVGFELRRLKIDDSIEWLIRITPDSISIHCLDYSRWNHVYPMVEKYSESIFEKLKGVGVSPSSIGLKYVDQFVFRGEPKDYDIANLFKRDSSVLHTRSFSSGCQWHSHSGWFEKIEGLGEVLSQINIDSVIQEPQRYIISIDHTGTYHNQIEGENLLCDSTFRALFADRIHELNKSLLSDLLTDKMQRRINLGSEDMT